MAPMAEYEAKAISARTRAALAAAKARGAELGGLRWDLAKVSAKGRKVALRTRQEKAAKYSADVLPVIQEKQRQGAVNLRQIAAALTPRSGSWSPVQVSRVLARG